MKLMKKILGAVSAFVLVFGLAAVVPATSSAADQNNLTGNVCNGIQVVITGQGPSGTGGSDGSECKTDGDGTDSLAKTINKLINLFSMVVGAASVIMIIYGGFKYITSGGNDDSTKDAKNTILYALVGLIIVLVAQTIVKFVFTKATSLNSDASQ
jgi:cytochrome bd-type quinol oxidase subunit 2